MRIRLLIAIVAVAVASCSDGTTSPDGGATSAPPATESTAEVSIVGLRFQPADIEVAAGTTVRWVNREQAIPHTSTGDGWDSGTLEPGESFSFTFTEPGTFEYVCTIHPSMAGTVTVSG